MKEFENCISHVETEQVGKKTRYFCHGRWKEQGTFNACLGRKGTRMENSKHLELYVMRNQKMFEGLCDRVGRTSSTLET